MIRSNEIQYIIEYGTCTLYGSSVPEDAKAFYKPLLDHLQIIIDGKRDLDFHFKLEYTNTASTLYISSILYMLQDLSKHAKVKVNWYYLKDDEDLKDLGMSYKEFIKVPINLIEVN